jgi:hypothetical protein
MNQESAKQFAIEFIEKHPKFKTVVTDYYYLMLNEIEEGGSETNEVNIFVQSCEDLLN